jgi:hypothetical protein
VRCAVVALAVGKHAVSGPLSPPDAQHFPPFLCVYTCHATQAAGRRIQLVKSCTVPIDEPPVHHSLDMTSSGGLESRPFFTPKTARIRKQALRRQVCFGTWCEPAA